MLDVSAQLHVTVPYKQFNQNGGFDECEATTSLGWTGSEAMPPTLVLKY